MAWLWKQRWGQKRHDPGWVSWVVDWVDRSGRAHRRVFDDWSEAQAFLVSLAPQRRT